MTRAYLNKNFGELVTIAQAVKHLAEHPKAKFYSRINNKELKIVTEKGISRFAELTEKTIETKEEKPVEEPETEEKLPEKKPVAKKTTAKKPVKAPTPKVKKPLVKITKEDLANAQAKQ